MHPPAHPVRGAMRALLAACALSACISESTTPLPGEDGTPAADGSGDGTGDGQAQGDGTPQDDGDPGGDGEPQGDGGGGDGTPDVPACDGGAGSCVKVVGRQLFVDGQLFHVQGVSWNPIPRGGTHPNSLDYAGFADQDIALMRDAGINVVRTYEPIEDTGVLDKLHDAGIYVINSVYPYGGAPVSLAVDRVERLKDHPAILMWLVGNEWNYNNLYTGNQHDLAWTVQRVEEVASAIKGVDDSHPVLTSHGHTPQKNVIDAIPSVDVWGVNIYTGIQFAGLFDEFRQRSKKPLLVTEYGADAWNAQTGGPDENAQAEATRQLTEQIFENASAFDADELCVGGTIYSWVDEWDKAGNPDAHDPGGSAPGGGPYPDMVFNEEYWGIVDIDRNPRPAYYALRDVLNAH